MFDGDEVNLWALQTTEAIAEAMSVMNIKENMISNQSGKLIVTVIQDVLLGLYSLSLTNNMKKDIFMQLMAATYPNGQDIVIYDSLMKRVATVKGWNGKGDYYKFIDTLPNNEVYNGRVLFSSLLPEDFVYDAHDVVIKNGVMLSGILVKENITGAQNSIIQYIHKSYGSDAAANMVTRAQVLGHEVLRLQGASLTYDDCIIQDPVRQKKINDTIEDIKLRAPTIKDEKKLVSYLDKQHNYIAKIALDDRDVITVNIDGATSIKLAKLATELNFAEPYVKEDSLDVDTLSTITIINSKKQIIVEYKNGESITHKNGSYDHVIITKRGTDKDNIETWSITEPNAFKRMLLSGSKGSLGNIANIAGIVGQQSIQQERIKPTFTNNTRITSHIVSNSKDPSDYGFIYSNYITGFDPMELYFANMAARESLSDIQKTSETGYTSRRMIKIAEDNVRTQTGVIMNSNRVITQFYSNKSNLRVDTMVNIKGVKTFVNPIQAVESVKVTPSDYAYFYLVTSSSEANAVYKNINTLTATDTKAKIVVLHRSNVLMPRIANKDVEVVEFDFTDSSVVYEFTEYKKIAILSPYLVFQNNPDSIFNYNTPAINVISNNWYPWNAIGEEPPTELYDNKEFSVSDIPTNAVNRYISLITPGNIDTTSTIRYYLPNKYAYDKNAEKYEIDLLQNEIPIAYYSA